MFDVVNEVHVGTYFDLLNINEHRLLCRGRPYQFPHWRACAP